MADFDCAGKSNAQSKDDNLSMKSMIKRLVHRIPLCLNNLSTSYFWKVGISLLLNNMKQVLKDSRGLSNQMHDLFVIGIVTF